MIKRISLAVLMAVSLGGCTVHTYSYNPPVVYSPRPVYVAPRPPVYVVPPRPVYVPPPVYVAPRYYHRPHRCWRCY